ncbi:MAG TPA: outer membrane beta-barrel protein [Flavobacteriaceae bacterium]|nr:outer membrane beta-barrel protein [Flavobacteriaceae bacterium]
MKKYLLLFGFCVFFFENSIAQRAFDFGGGALISVGFQEEWGVDVRAHYHTNEKWGFSGEYNLFFRRDVTSQNTETFSEITLNVNYKLMEIVGISVFGGLGYTGNNFDMNQRDPDSSNIYFETGNFNHGAQIKFLGNLPLGKSVKLFAELNLKSFGRRYDTFVFGLLYSIPMY